MERDFTHTLNLLQTLREASIKPSTIESVIGNMPLSELEKKTMFILNRGQSSTPKFSDSRVVDYVCYKTASDDHKAEYIPHELVFYRVQKDNTYHN